MLVIFNYAARRGRAKRHFRKIQGLIRQTGLPFDYIFTQKPGEATEITKGAVKDKESLVVAVGGDGTINEVAAGLVGSETNLTVIPVGIGNDFARNLGIPLKIEKAVEILKAEQREIRRVDLIRIGEDRYAINALGIGFDAAVAEWVKDFRWTGFPFWEYIAYLAGIGAEIFSHREQTITINVPALQLCCVGPALMLVCANGPAEGRHFVVAPKAELDDGLMDVCLIGKIPRLFRPLYAVAGKWGYHLKLPRVSSFKTQRLTISTPLPRLLAQMDGETIALPNKVEVEVIPKALRVVVPRRDD